MSAPSISLHRCHRAAAAAALVALLALVAPAPFAGVASVAGAEDAEGQDAPVAIDALLRPPSQFAGQLGSYRSPLVFADGSRVRSAADWPRRRAEILAEWHGLMGAWPALLPRVPIEILSESHRETFVQRRVRLEVAPGQKIEGWLLVPDALPPRAPAVLVPFYEPETSVGLGERPLRDFARLLTRAGFVTL